MMKFTCTILKYLSNVNNLCAKAVYSRQTCRFAAIHLTNIHHTHTSKTSIYKRTAINGKINADKNFGVDVNHQINLQRIKNSMGKLKYYFASGRFLSNNFKA